jgi:hypothetical protein
MPSLPDRSPQDLDAPHPTPRVVHLPLRGRDGAALGVEPISRSSEPEPVDDERARRARALARNAWRSTPPPAA